MLLVSLCGTRIANCKLHLAILSITKAGEAVFRDVNKNAKQPPGSEHSERRGGSPCSCDGKRCEPEQAQGSTAWRHSCEGGGDRGKAGRHKRTEHGAKRNGAITLSAQNAPCVIA